MTKADKKKNDWATIMLRINQYRLPEAATLIRAFDEKYFQPRKTRTQGKRNTS